MRKLDMGCSENKRSQLLKVIRAEVIRAKVNRVEAETCFKNKNKYSHVTLAFVDLQFSAQSKTQIIKKIHF